MTFFSDRDIKKMTILRFIDDLHLRPMFTETQNVPYIDFKCCSDTFAKQSSGLLLSDYIWSPFSGCNEYRYVTKNSCRGEMSSCNMALKVTWRIK